MRKRYFVSAAGTIGVSAIVGYLLSSKENRAKFKEKLENVTNIFRKNEIKDQTLQKAGIPDQLENKDLEQLENAKMVSEGSQYGVQYYNEVKYDDDENRIHH